MPIHVRSSLGLAVLDSQDAHDRNKVADDDKKTSAEESSSVIRLPMAKPFETVQVKLTLKAHLPQSKDSSYIEHRVSNIPVKT